MSVARFPLRPSAFAPPPDLGRFQRNAWIVGLVGAVLTVVGALLQPTQFFRSYLTAIVFWAGVPLGCLGLAMMHHLTRGTWGIPVRRIFEAAARTLPLVGVLFVPVFFGLRTLYRWMDPAAVASDELLKHKAHWLNAGGYVGRAIVYFVVWSVIAWVLAGLSRRQDESADPNRQASAMRRLSAAGLLVYGFTASLAAVDWLMSLEPHWYSSIFGLIVIGLQALGALSFTIPVALFLARREPMTGVFRPHHFHDYGKLLLTFVMLWGYFAVAQLIITWSGNLPDEIAFYLPRWHHGWPYLALVLALANFALPFALLLSRNLKRDGSRLAPLAVLLLVMTWLNTFWLVAPSFSSRITIHWLDVACLLGVGGIWVALFLGQLARRPLLPVNDPFLVQTMGQEKEVAHGG